jgi:hypothetical protein
MQSPLSLRHPSSRLARALALAALLCALAVPVLEAGHLHGLGDGGGAECLLCKSAPLLATLAAAMLLLLPRVPAARPGLCRPAVVSTACHTRRARGPPSRS